MFCDQDYYFRELYLCHISIFDFVPRATVFRVCRLKLLGMGNLYSRRVILSTLLLIVAVAETRP